MINLNFYTSKAMAFVDDCNRIPETSDGKSFADIRRSFIESKSSANTSKKAVEQGRIIESKSVSLI